MYGPFWRAWTAPAPGNVVQRSTLYTALRPPPLPEGLVLPDEFVAVKWYFRPSLPDTPKNRVRVREITEALAERTPGIFLHDNPRLDDHEEVDLSAIPGLRAMLGGVPPERNLEMQSAIIARAKGSSEHTEDSVTCHSSMASRAGCTLATCSTSAPFMSVSASRLQPASASRTHSWTSTT